jgi:hypothetical protein
MSTDIMRRAISKKFVDEYRNPSLVISLILRDRSLNFEIEEVSFSFPLPPLPSPPAGSLGPRLLHPPDPRGFLSSEVQAAP